MSMAKKRLTREQRRIYRDDLAHGVPEDVIAEFDTALDKYIADYTRALSEHFIQQDG